MFENLASVGADSPLRKLCVEHFTHAMFHQFPWNFGDALRLILAGCDSQAVPAALFGVLTARLGVDALLAEEWRSAHLTTAATQRAEIPTEKVRSGGAF